jgi:pectate lyase
MGMSQVLGNQTARSRAAGFLILMAGLLNPQPVQAQFEDSPIGWASVSDLGLDGTTGGDGGDTVTVSDATSLRNAIGASGPRIVQICGTIQFSGTLNVASDKTILGLADTAGIDGGGLQMSGVHNVIIRNIAFSNASVNSLTVTEGSHHVWIDHCDFTQASDTLIDIKRASSYVTVSWSHFTDTLETILQGHSDSFTQDIGYLKVTYHHNWFDGTQERHPRVRFAEPVHVFNNYFLNIPGYGVGSTENAGVLVEANFFENVRQPTLTDVGSSSPGRLVERNNIYLDSGDPQTSGDVDEPGNYYDYTPDDPADVPDIVRNGAGVGQIGS